MEQDVHPGLCNTASGPCGKQPYSDRVMRVADRRIAARRVADRRVADRRVADRRVADRRVAATRQVDVLLTYVLLTDVLLTAGLGKLSRKEFHGISFMVILSYDSSGFLKSYFPHVHFQVDSKPL